MDQKTHDQPTQEEELLEEILNDFNTWNKEDLTNYAKAVRRISLEGCSIRSLKEELARIS